MSLFRRHPRKEADATVSHVEMLKRVNYGTATVRVTYAVEPLDEPRFDATHDATVKMATLPQAGQQVRIAYHPADRAKFDVLTLPGQETGTITEPTPEIPYHDGHMPYASEGEIQHLREQVHALSDPIPGRLEALKQLGELRDSGVLTEAEFEA